MQRVLVHIGYHKTGSTWMQQELFSAESATFMPLSTGPRRRHSLARAFVYGDDGDLLSPFDLNEASLRRQLEDIEAGFDESTTGRLPVMSHERLSGNPHASGFDAKVIAERIATLFPDARILIVVREQGGFLLSNYFQYLNTGGTDSLSRYLSTPYDGKRPHFSGSHAAYVPLVRAYRRLFGSEGVLVLPYEMFCESPETFVGRVGAFVGRPIAVDPARLRVRRNATERQWVSYRLRRLNPFLWSNSLNGHSGWNRPVARGVARGLVGFAKRVVPLSWDRTISLRLEEEIREWCSGRYRQSNAELSQLIGIDLAEYGYDRS